MFLRKIVLLLIITPLLTTACGGDDDPPREQPPGCTVGDDSTCENGLTCQATPGGEVGCYCSIDSNDGCDEEAGLFCEATQNGTNDCYSPLYVAGQVFDLQTSEPIEGAKVVARDANNVAQSGVATTDAAGMYQLRVSATRDANGAPVQQEPITLRADATGYRTFPTPPRFALPVDIVKASGDPLTVQGTTTDIAMLPLQDATGRGTITGTVNADRPRGTLVVAGGSVNAGGGVTGVADVDGTYWVFNVPAGTQTVKGYKAGLQLDSASANVTAGEVTEGVDLNVLDHATWTVDGKVEIVNPGNGKDTSVIFVVDETFNPNAIYGEAPPGLRAYPVSGDFQIHNVPDGNYVVLAAFENDFLVRDPDTAIGGTEIVHVTISGNTVLDQSFKVTGSLDVISPDNEQEVSGTPSFTWEDDSGEDHYEIVVYDAYGTLIWEDLAVPGFSGSDPVVDYAGPALTSGMIYQFRATSIKQGGSPISKTEDLRGTFLYQ